VRFEPGILGLFTSAHGRISFIPTESPGQDGEPTQGGAFNDMADGKTTDIKIEAKPDFLKSLASASPIAAVSELIWNGFDARAKQVKVVLEPNELNGLHAIRVSDDGDGIDWNNVDALFGGLGNSWKAKAQRHSGRSLHEKTAKGGSEHLHSAKVSNGDATKKGQRAAVIGRNSGSPFPGGTSNLDWEALKKMDISMANELGGGWIYVMMSSSDYNRFKVGKTTLNPVDRWKGLRTADPTLGFLAAYFVPDSVGPLSTIEADMHSRLEGRIRFFDESKSEWFTGTAEWACGFLDDLFEDWMDQPVARMARFDTHRVCRAYEEDLAHFYRPIRPLNSIDGLPM
jgi:DNA mismatch repair enzyme (predicted ATPase)